MLDQCIKRTQREQEGNDGPRKERGGTLERVSGSTSHMALLAMVKIGVRCSHEQLIIDLFGAQSEKKTAGYLSSEAGLSRISNLWMLVGEASKKGGGMSFGVRVAQSRSW